MIAECPMVAAVGEPGAHAFVLKRRASWRLAGLSVMVLGCLNCDLDIPEPISETVIPDRRRRPRRTR